MKTEKFFGNLHPTKWVPLEIELNKGSKNVRVGRKGWTAGEIWAKNRVVGVGFNDNFQRHRWTSVAGILAEQLQRQWQSLGVADLARWSPESFKVSLVMSFNGGKRKEREKKEKRKKGGDVLHVFGEKKSAESQILSNWGLQILKKKYHSIGSRKKSNLPLNNITIFTIYIYIYIY